MTKIFIVDDYEPVRTLIKLWLEGHHKVVATAATYEDAMLSVPKLIAVGAQVAILDGSLGHSQNDGQEIADAIRKAAPSIKIISSSGQIRSWGDVNLMKPYSKEDLLEAISKLTGGT